MSVASVITAVIDGRTFLKVSVFVVVSYNAAAGNSSVNTYLIAKPVVIICVWISTVYKVSAFVVGTLFQLSVINHTINSNQKQISVNIGGLYISEAIPNISVWKNYLRVVNNNAVVVGNQVAIFVIFGIMSIFVYFPVRTKVYYTVFKGIFECFA